MSKHRIKWRSIKTFDYGYALIPSKKALDKHQKTIKHEGMGHDLAFGACYEIHRNGDIKPHSIVTVSHELDDRPLYQVVSIITHEAVHVFQNMCKSIAEDQPSPEFEAYTVEQISQDLLFDFLTARRPADLKALGF